MTERQEAEGEVKSEAETVENPPNVAANPASASTSSAYGLLVLLTLINILNFVDRQLLSSFANFIKPELELTDTQYGLLTGLFFIIFYATAGLFMGMLADLTHRPRLIAIAITVWSILTAASGAAKNFVTLAIPRALVGIGESALTPTAMSLLADRFKPSQLGFAAGFYYLGVPMGAGASLLVAGYFGQSIGWRNCFYTLGCGGLVLAVLTLFVRETRLPRATHANAPTFGAQFALLRQALVRSPSLSATILGGLLLQVAVGAALFDQLWYVQERGFERAEIARISGYITFAGGITGNLVGGFIGDWWQRRMRSGRPMLLFWMFLLLGPFVIAYRLLPGDQPLFWVGMFVGIFGLASFLGPTFATVQELAPTNARGTVIAFYVFVLQVFGISIGTTGAGWAIDQLRTAGVAQPYTWALLGFTLVSLFALPAFFYAGRRFNKDLAALA